MSPPPPPAAIVRRYLPLVRVASSVQQISVPLQHVRFFTCNLFFLLASFVLCAVSFFLFVLLLFRSYIPVWFMLLSSRTRYVGI